MRDGELTQITKDDTFVQTLVDEGRITREEAHSHPQRSLIMRALTGHEVEPTLTMREARAGDRYLLCSDGLSDPVSDETIHEALQIPDVAESAYRLIELALRGGGPDNVTVVVADVVDYDYGQTQPILAGAVSGEDDQLTTLPNTSAGRASAIGARKEVAKPAPLQEESVQRPRWPRRRMFIVATLAILLVLAGLAIGRAIIRSNYYVADYNGMVSIVRGIQGSLLGMSLHEPYLVGCLNARNELSVISYSQYGSHLDCRVMQLQDLRPRRARTGSGRASRWNAGRRPEAQLRGIIRELPTAAVRRRAPPQPPGSPAPMAGAPPPASVTAPTPFPADHRAARIPLALPRATHPRGARDPVAHVRPPRR